MMMVHLRPILSETSPAASAPKKVPAERMETIREVLLELIALAPGWTSSMNSGEARTPLM